MGRDEEVTLSLSLIFQLFVNFVEIMRKRAHQGVDPASEEWIVNQMHILKACLWWNLAMKIFYFG
uniref:Uncharacterized protein n=1 Tax=Brassica oleracea TaxID=3712 RepID=A0A3P6G781_BRAOL|nr:unnamed protein product [Brassica oleracea]